MRLKTHLLKSLSHQFLKRLTNFLMRYMTGLIQSLKGCNPKKWIAHHPMMRSHLSSPLLWHLESFISIRLGLLFKQMRSFKKGKRTVMGKWFNPTFLCKIANTGACGASDGFQISCAFFVSSLLSSFSLLKVICNGHTVNFTLNLTDQLFGIVKPAQRLESVWLWVLLKIY